MMNQETAQEIDGIEAQIESARRRCARIQYLLYVILGLFLFVALAMLLLGIYSISSVTSVSFDAVNLISAAVSFTVSLAVMGTLLVAFRLIARGESPFAQSVVRCIRWCALLFVLKAAIEVFFSLGAIQVTGVPLVGAIGYNAAPLNSLYIGEGVVVDAGALAAAGVAYCLASVLEYGSLVQRVSDDTL